MARHFVLAKLDRVDTKHYGSGFHFFRIQFFIKLLAQQQKQKNQLKDYLIRTERQQSTPR